MSITFTLDGLPPSLNTLLRMHWAKRQKIYDDWAMQTQYAYLAATHPAQRRAKYNTVNITFIIADNIRRDIDNLIGGGKGILDGLKKIGVIEDDNWLDCTISWSIQRGKANMTQITLTNRP